MISIFEQIDAFPDSIVLVLLGAAFFLVLELMGRHEKKTAKWTPPSHRIEKDVDDFEKYLKEKKDREAA